MFKLFKFFKVSNAAKFSTEATDALTKAFRSHLGGIPSGHTLGTFSKVENVLKYNGIEVTEMAKGLKAGNMEFITKIFSNGRIPESLTKKLISDVEHLPHYHSNLNKQFTTAFEKKFTKEEINLLKTKTPDTAKIINMEKMKSIYKSVQGTVLKAFTGTTVAVAGGIAAFVILVENHRKATTGCFMLSYDRNKKLINMCKLHELSCYNSKPVDNTNLNVTLCSTNDRSLLPENMKGNQCQHSTGTGLNCYNCPSPEWDENKDELTSEWNEANFAETQKDQVLIECREPSFFDALSDILDNVKDFTLNTVLGTANALGNFFRYIVIAILVLVTVGVSGFIVYVLTKVFTNIKSKNSLNNT